MIVWGRDSLARVSHQFVHRTEGGKRWFLDPGRAYTIVKCVKRRRTLPIQFTLWLLVWQEAFDLRGADRKQTLTPST